MPYNKESVPHHSNASEFRQIWCDFEWDGQAFLDQFHRGLRGEIKNVLLNFLEPKSLNAAITLCVATTAFLSLGRRNILEPKSLNEAITQAMRCDNHLFKFEQEEHPIQFNSTWSSTTRSHPATWSIVMPPHIVFYITFNSCCRF
jgi:hypothetical protein